MQQPVILIGVAIGKETICGSGGVCVGYRSQTNQKDVIHIGRDNTSNAVGADVFGVNRNNTTPNSLILGNNAYVNMRANTGCDIGTTAVPFKDYFSSGSITGSVNTRLTNDIVSNTGTSVSGDLCAFSGTSGKVITSSSIVPGNIVTNPGTSVTGNLSSFSSATGKIITDSGKAAANVVTDSGTATTGRVATYTGTKVINDSGTLLTDLATNASVTAGLALKVSKSGDTMSGALAMGTNNITNIGTLSGSTNSRTANDIISCTTLPTYGRLPMFAVPNKVIEDSGISSFDVVTGPAIVVNNNLASYNLTTGKIIKDSGILSTNVVTGPASAVINNIAVYGSTTGKAITTVTSGIGTLGALTLANTTASSSPTTGTLIISGSGAGLGVNGKVFTNDNVVIGPTQTITHESKLVLRGTVNSANGPHYNAYVPAVSSVSTVQLLT